MQAPAPTAAPGLKARDTTVLPLTTIFTPPQSCFDAPFTLETSSSGVAGFSTAWRDEYETSSECYPPYFSSLEYPWGWYSPGVCASGYNIAEISTYNALTQAWCCPSGFTISGSVGGGLTYQFCSSLASNTGLIGFVNNISTTFTPSYSFVALQYPISVEWAASDLSLFTPASAPVLTTDVSSTISKFTGTLPTTGGRKAGPTSTATHTATDSGLSTGAEAGIAVGAVVAVVTVLAGVIFWMIRRRRGSKRRILDSDDKSNAFPYVDNKIELPTEEPRRAKHEQSPVELNAMSSPQELEVGEGAVKKVNSEQSPVELDSNWNGHDRAG
jgi:hypothetical protein